MLRISTVILLISLALQAVVQCYPTQSIYLNDVRRAIVRQLDDGDETYENRWPNGIVPYVIEGSFCDEEWEAIEYAIEEINTKTCVQIKPHTDEEHYVAITNKDDGCYASFGYQKTNGNLNLVSSGCFDLQTPLHEFLHVLGIDHEHQRPDRDDYVTIMWDNIDPENWDDYKISPDAKTFGVPYDYRSVVHYPAESGSINGELTIVPLQDEIDPDTVGRSVVLSEGDIQKINAIYDCRTW